MIIAGIDPGVQPCIAVLDTKDNAVIFREDTCLTITRNRKSKRHAEAQYIASILAETKPEIVIVEEVNPMPKQGISGTGAFMRARGVIEGVCAGMGLLYVLVPPQTWTLKMQVRRGNSKNKDAALARALALMPHLASELSKKKDHNRADAMLLALYGKQFVVPSHPFFS